MKDKLKAGDVFTFKKLKNCHYSYESRKNKKPKLIKNVLELDDSYDTEYMIFKMKNGVAKDHWEKMSLRLTDKDKLKASTSMWVVISDGMEGGGRSHGRNDIYPDGWHIKAKMLSSKGKWKDKNPTTEFYQSGNCYRNEISPDKINFVGYMDKKFFTQKEKL